MITFKLNLQNKETIETRIMNILLVNHYCIFIDSRNLIFLAIEKELD